MEDKRMVKRWFMIFGAVLILFPGTAMGESDDPVVAIVGSEEIRESDVQKAKNLRMEQIKKKSVPKMDLRLLLNEIIDLKLLAQEGRKVGLDKDPRIQFAIKNAEEVIIAREYKNNLVSKVEVEEEELKAYYDSRPESFIRPESYHVRHIAVDSEEEAKAVLAELKEGADFEKLASEKSVVKTRGVGGSLGWVTKGMLRGELEKALFQMKVDEISGVIFSDGKYHIIKLEGFDEAQKQPFEKVKPRITRLVKRDKTQKALDVNLEKLRKNAGVRVLADE
jgi:parvulin-like peptidyl-prolyl isomerase